MHLLAVCNCEVALESHGLAAQASCVGEHSQLLLRNCTDRLARRCQPLSLVPMGRKQLLLAQVVWYSSHVLDGGRECRTGEEASRKGKCAWELAQCDTMHLFCSPNRPKQLSAEQQQRPVTATRTNTDSFACYCCCA